MSRDWAAPAAAGAAAPAGHARYHRPVTAPDPPPAGDPDLPLLQAFAAGDLRASRILVDRHLTRLHGLAWRLLDDREEAEDVVQECFLKLWQQAGRWQPRARIATWLYQVTLNAARDRQRRRRSWAALDPELAADSHAGPQEQSAVEQHQRQLRQALRALPERQREAILLSHFEQLSQREAAAAMEISEDALEALLVRARRALRQQLLPGAVETAERRP